VNRARLKAESRALIPAKAKAHKVSDIRAEAARFCACSDIFPQPVKSHALPLPAQLCDQAVPFHVAPDAARLEIGNDKMFQMLKNVAL
jgi:hypothetical protein